MPSDTLIFATSYVSSNQAREIVELWARVTRKLNPKTDMLLVDSASPIDLTAICRADDIKFFSFPENIGHLNLTGQDGWGRAFCKGVEYAIEEGYEYLVNLDADMLFTKPCAPYIERMKRTGVQVCCAFDTTYHFLETAVSFWRVDYLNQIDFITKYDWPNPPKPPTTAVPERRVEEIIKDDVFTLPLRGFRDDLNQVHHNNINSIIPEGIDYLTHVKDISLLKRFLKRNGIEA